MKLYLFSERKFLTRSGDELTFLHKEKGESQSNAESSDGSASLDGGPGVLLWWVERSSRGSMACLFVSRYEKKR